MFYEFYGYYPELLVSRGYKPRFVFLALGFRRRQNSRSKSNTCPESAFVCFYVKVMFFKHLSYNFTSLTSVYIHSKIKFNCIQVSL